MCFIPLFCVIVYFIIQSAEEMKLISIAIREI